MSKILLGKENHLFLKNDSCKELEIHCNNLNLVKDLELKHLSFSKYMLVIFPDKSCYYKKYLPDEYECKYRPAFNIYLKKLGNRIIDGLECLKDIDLAYYKTDTHINLKGNYIIYKSFINRINSYYGLKLNVKKLKIKVLNDVELSKLNKGIGDLTWPNNKGDIVIPKITDNYFYSDDLLPFYIDYKIDGIYCNILDYKLNDCTNDLLGKSVLWNIISKYILYKNNIESDNNFKVIIFYDSFLLQVLTLYMELFKEVYMIKSTYNNNLIELIKPDFVFQFCVERFLY